MCNSLLQQRQEQELQNREKVPQTYFTAHSGVLKRIRAVLECGSTRSTLPPQLSESWSRREEISASPVEFRWMPGGAPA